jgi:hypothetical protein
MKRSSSSAMPSEIRYMWQSRLLRQQPPPATLVFRSELLSPRA